MSTSINGDISAHELPQRPSVPKEPTMTSAATPTRTAAARAVGATKVHGAGATAVIALDE
jgi:hypothetical protein